MAKHTKGHNSLPPLSFAGVFRIISQDDTTIQLCCVNKRTMEQWVITAVVYYAMLLLLDPRLLGLIDWMRRVQVFFDSAYILGALLPLGAVYFFRLKGEATLVKSGAGGMMTYSYTDILRQKNGTVPFSQIDSVVYYEHAQSAGYLYLVCANNGPVFLLSPPQKHSTHPHVQEYSLTLADWIGCGWNHIGRDGAMVSQLPRRS